MVVTKTGGLGVSDAGFVGWGESEVGVDGRVEKTVLVTVSVTVAVTVWTLPGNCRSRRIGRLGPSRGLVVPWRARPVALRADVSCSSDLLSFKLQSVRYQKCAKSNQDKNRIPQDRIRCILYRN